MQAPGEQAVIKRAAGDAGALGCSLSGSGPSLLALCASPEIATTVAAAMEKEIEAVVSELQKRANQKK